MFILITKTDARFPTQKPVCTFAHLPVFLCVTKKTKLKTDEAVGMILFFPEKNIIEFLMKTNQPQPTAKSLLVI